LDKAKQSTSTGGGKTRSSKTSKVRRSPYQLPATSSSSSTAAATGKLQITGGELTDGGGIACDKAGPPPLMPLLTAANPHGYDYAGCDVVKV